MAPAVRCCRYCWQIILRLFRPIFRPMRLWKRLVPSWKILAVAVPASVFEPVVAVGPAVGIVMDILVAEAVARIVVNS